MSLVFYFVVGFRAVSWWNTGWDKSPASCKVAGFSFPPPTAITLQPHSVWEPLWLTEGGKCSQETSLIILESDSGCNFTSNKFAAQKPQIAVQFCAQSCDFAPGWRCCWRCDKLQNWLSAGEYYSCCCCCCSAVAGFHSEHISFHRGHWTTGHSTFKVISTRYLYIIFFFPPVI